MRIGKFAVVTVSALAALTIAYVFISYLNARHKARTIQHETQVQNNFLEKAATYAEVVSAWRETVPTLTECGTPNREPGLVQWREIEALSDGSYNIAINMDSYNHISPDEVASKLQSTNESVEKLVNALKKVGNTEVQQHDLEVRVRSPDGEFDGLMFVPSNCANTAYYPNVTETNGSMGFSYLKRLNANRFYYVDRR